MIVSSPMLFCLSGQNSFDFVVEPLRKRFADCFARSRSYLRLRGHDRCADRAQFLNWQRLFADALVNPDVTALECREESSAQLAALPFLYRHLDRLAAGARSPNPWRMRKVRQR